MRRVNYSINNSNIIQNVTEIISTLDKINKDKHCWYNYNSKVLLRVPSVILINAFQFQISSQNRINTWKCIQHLVNPFPLLEKIITLLIPIFPVGSNNIQPIQQRHISQ